MKEPRYEIWERMYWFGDDEEAMAVGDERRVVKGLTFSVALRQIMHFRDTENCVDPRFSIGDYWMVPE